MNADVLFGAQRAVMNGRDGLQHIMGVRRTLMRRPFAPRPVTGSCLAPASAASTASGARGIDSLLFGLAATENSR